MNDVESTCLKSSSRFSSILRSRLRIAGVLLLVAIGLGAVTITSTPTIFVLDITSPKQDLEDIEDPVTSVVPLPRIYQYNDSPLHSETIFIWKTPPP